MTEGRTPAAKVRFCEGSGGSIKPGALVYIKRCASEHEPQLLTTIPDDADPRHPEPVGVIEPGPTFKLNARGEQLLKALE